MIIKNVISVFVSIECLTGLALRRVRDNRPLGPLARETPWAKAMSITRKGRQLGECPCLGLIFVWIQL